MKQISAAMFLTAALSLGVSAFAQTAPTNPTGQVDAPTGQAAPQKPADLKDVPAGHWAQEAIKIAADCGIIRGYPDGTFRGNQPITRYEAAAIVARLIAMIKSGACGIGAPGTGGFSITEEQYNDLMSAVQELQADLAQLGVRVAELEDNAVTQDDLARVEELATQARDIAEQAASTADEALAAAADAADAAAAAQEAADASAEAIQAAQDAADAAQAAADDALARLDDLEVTPAGDIIDTSAFASADDIAALQDQIDALQEALDGMEPAAEFDPAELQDQIADLQAQIDDLNAQIADAGTGGETFDPTDLEAQIADLQDQVSALTETVDGLVDSTAGLQDDVGTLQDTVADLQAQIDALGGNPDAGGELMDAIDAASIAADTALAQSRELQDKVDELDGRVTDLESGLGELGATVESQADSIAALNDLVVLLNQDVLSLQDRVTQLERQVEELSGAEPVEPGVDLTDDLDSLREFTTLLRRDQTALADTVGDLEARVGALETKVDTGLGALDKRVSALENNAFTISGTIGFSYYTSRVWTAPGKGLGKDFDIDRLGIGSFLSSGANDDVDDDTPVDYADFARGFNAVNKSGAATGAAMTPIEGVISPSVELNFTFKERPYTEASGGFSTGQAITLTLVLDTTTPYTNKNNNGSEVNKGTFTIKKLATSFNIGNAPLTFVYGFYPKFKFSEYGFNNGGDGRGDGFIATLDGSGVLPLNAMAKVAYGSYKNNDNVPYYFTGFYGSLSLIPGITGGVYYGYEGADITANQAYNETVIGANLDGKLFGFVGLKGEYTSSSNGGVGLFVKADVALDPFTISFNYRKIDPGLATVLAGVSNNNGLYDFDQTGFGVSVKATSLFGFLDLGGFYDSLTSVGGEVDQPDPLGLLAKFSYGTTAAGVKSATAFGVTAGLNIIGFKISPYFLSLTDSAPGITGTGLGVDVKGSLFSLVNLAAGFQSRTGGFVTAYATDLYVYGDLGIAFGDIKITPKGWFETRAGGTDNQSDLGFGVDVSTPFLFGSSLSIRAASDTNTHSTLGYTAHTGLISASLSWSQFLLPNSSFTIEFASRLDQNRGISYQGTRWFGASFASPKGIGSFGSDTNGTSATITGLDFQFTYYGLSFRYGIFNFFDFGANSTWGQAFGISYKVKF
jgi:predicted  nucleic acid-binding Zn-ribbon protein